MVKTKLNKAIKLALAFGVASTTALNAYAYEEANTEEVEVAERIEVTGSRIKRMSEIAPTPVTVISGVELTNAGITNVADLLQNLPSSAKGSAPTTTTNTIFGAGINTTDLRELGPERTLVLVNGRRFVSASPTNSSVNLNSIPSSVIDRIEVVHGGASAVYGSDAVAGVVNIILKKSHDGVSVDYLTSEPQQDGGEDDYLNITFGNEGEDTSFIFNISYSEQGQLKEADRDFIVNPVNSMLNPDNTGPDDGIPNRVIFGQQLTLGAYDKAGDVWLWPGQWQQYVFGENGQLEPFNTGTGTRPLPNSQAYYTGDANGYNFLENSYIATPLKRFNVFSTINHELNDNHRMSFEFALGKDTAHAEASPVFLAKHLRADNAFWHSSAREILDQYYTPDELIRVNKLAADFGNRKFEDDRLMLNGTLAFEGVIFEDYDYTFYIQEGMNKTETLWHGEILNEQLDNALDAVMIDGQIRCADRNDDGEVVGALLDCSPLNLFGLGAASQEAIDYVSTTAQLNMKKQQRVVGATISGYAFELPAGGVSFALSGEYREEKAESNPGTGMSKGLIFNNFVNPWEAKFDVKEMGLEVSVPVLADKYLAKELTLDVAARYMDYSTVGDNVAWKAGFSWSPTDEIRVRGTRSKSVRAPSLDDLFNAGIQSFGGYSDPCDAPNIEEADADVKQNVINNCIAAGIPVSDDWRPSEDWRQITPPSVNGGNPALQEETSDDSLLGIIYTPTEDLTFIADYWKFKVEDAINSLGPNTVVYQCYEASSLDNPSCALVTRDPATLDISNVINAPYNVASYELEGVDIESTYNLETSFGDFNFRLLATYLKHREFISDINEEGYEFNPTVGEQRYPRWKARFTAGYSYEDLFVQLTANYRHSTVGNREWTIEQNNYNEIPSYINWDLFARYHLTDNVELRGGVNNLFDVEPPRNPFSYDNGEFYDVYGRTFTFGVNVSF
ncbi:TonB-dependent receptor domain-containing protein [Thalassotalea fusca]